MEDELNLEIGLSGDGLSEEETAAAVQTMQEAEADRAELREQNALIEEQKAEANNPKGVNPVAEVVRAPIAGVRDGIANIITIPERVIDFASGEMSR